MAPAMNTGRRPRLSERRPKNGEEWYRQQQCLRVLPDHVHEWIRLLTRNVLDAAEGRRFRYLQADVHPDTGEQQADQEGNPPTPDEEVRRTHKERDHGERRSPEHDARRWPDLGKDPQNPRRPGGANSTAMSTAPPHSPPTANPCTSLRKSSSMGAQRPACSKVGRQPMRAVARLIIMRVRTRVALRPRRSP